jgi:hypothetical protein
MNFLAALGIAQDLGGKLFPQQAEAVSISENYKQNEATQDETVKLAIFGGALLVVLILAVLYFAKKR